MRDPAVLLLLLAACGATLWRPWLGVLALALFGYMNPHEYAWGFMTSFPVYQILFVVAAIATLMSKERQFLPADWRVPVFFLLWLYFFITTTQALVPIAAWAKLVNVSKIYLPLLLTLILINNREKLFWLIATIALSFGLLAVKGGLWAAMTGFAYRVYGPNGTQFSDNNHFAVVTIMTIPLLVLWMRETQQRWLRHAIMLAIPLCAASALSSWSRGGLLTLGVTGLVLIWHSRRKWLVVPLLLIAAPFALDLLPETWFSRMQTIETYEQESSAQQRFTAWRDGFNYALEHPFIGGGFEGWRYVTISDWHSSYIEIMAEHGLIAFFMWLSLLLGTMLSLTRLALRAYGIAGLEWVVNYATMLRASLIAYATGTIFLGLSYWDIFYHLVFISVLLKKFAVEALAEKQASTPLARFATA
jgi:probable O-glycosylation ligase (exosortase A-associated)